MITNKVARPYRKSFFQQILAIFKKQQKYAGWMLLIFKKCQICIILTMFLIFCQISGSCFYKIDHCKAASPVSLNCDKLQVISAGTEKQLFYTYFLKVDYTLFFDKNNFIRTKALVLNQAKNKAKNKARVAVLQNIRAKCPGQPFLK